MAFNEVNTDGRTLAPIGGRCLVFTNSRLTEFVLSDKTSSIPLYLHPSLLRNNEGIFFIAEFRGFLSFDRGSYFRVLEVGPYVAATFDPSTVRAMVLDSGAYSSPGAGGGDGPEQIIFSSEITSLYNDGSRLMVNGFQATYGVPGGEPQPSQWPISMSVSDYQTLSEMFLQPGMPYSRVSIFNTLYA